MHMELETFAIALELSEGAILCLCAHLAARWACLCRDTIGRDEHVT